MNNNTAAYRSPCLPIYKDHIKSYLTRLRRHARKIDAQIPPRVSVITQELRFTVDQLADSTLQRVSRYIIHEDEKGCTGSFYRDEH